MNEPLLMFLVALFLLVVFVLWSHSGASRDRRLAAQQRALDIDKRVSRIAVLELMAANWQATSVTLIAVVLLCLFCLGTDKISYQPNQEKERIIHYKELQHETGEEIIE